ncbi:hypothetical protein Glove_627g42 [Diversispora epigaea]|uniref:G-protein coupled receptors family 2 profile 2 domain-containing protein n=1 Tax=Diversispora epigaea TaxID=1348612 RepID=A0A397G8S4_9GLOM|nr:hypothetical protein Glove_627g42 [Diversispora epigaea]
MVRHHIILFFILFLIYLINGTLSEPSPANITCPSPLINDPNPSLFKSTCSEGCCLRCPFVNNFYPENKIDNIYYILSFIRIASFFAVLIIVLSYIVLPNKREHPAVTVLCFNSSLLIFLGITFFYTGDHKRIQCANDITQANISNNFLCGIQGIILIFTTFTLILYCFLLILHLHFQTVWHSNIIQRCYIIFQMFVLSISSFLTLLPAITKQISFEFGAVCLVSYQKAEWYFWTPLAVFVISGFIIHIWTFIHIAKSQCMFFEHGFDESTFSTADTTTSITKKEVLNAIKIQWRALMLALILLFTFIIYWVYKFISIRELSPLTSIEEIPAWIDQWKSCLINASALPINAQNRCSSISMPHVPSISLIVVAEFLTSILGISIFIIFGSSINFWNEWRFWFQNNRIGHLFEKPSQSQSHQTSQNSESHSSWV